MTTTLPNTTVAVVKRSLNPVFTTMTPSFKSKQKRNTTELSKAFWQAIDNGKNLRIINKWTISAISNIYRPDTPKCNLCVDEKLSNHPCVLIIDS